MQAFVAVERDRSSPGACAFPLAFSGARSASSLVFPAPPIRQRAPGPISLLASWVLPNGRLLERRLKLLEIFPVFFGGHKANMYFIGLTPSMTSDPIDDL